MADIIDGLPVRKGRARTSYLQGWRLYPFSVIGHHAQGVGVAWVMYQGTGPLIALAASWTLLYVAYQGLSVLRKNDSPGLDIADFMAGFLVGAVIVAALKAASL